MYQSCRERISILHWHGFVYEAHRGVISTFSWGGQNFFLFFNAPGLLKNWKKQHFICSNLTLFIVPFFLSFFFFLLFFLFFLFFLSFFLFSFSLGGATAPPAPLKWRPWRLIDLIDKSVGDRDQLATSRHVKMLRRGLFWTDLSVSLI